MNKPTNYDVQNGDIREETLGNVLDRIQREGADFMDWDEFIQYFTKRGRPIPYKTGFNQSRLTQDLGQLRNSEYLNNDENLRKDVWRIEDRPTRTGSAKNSRQIYYNASHHIIGIIAEIGLELLQITMIIEMIM